MHMKFETEFQSKLELRCQNQVAYRVQKPKKSNMATRQPFRKWGNWKTRGSYSYTQVLGHWSFEFIFKAKLKLESGNQKIQYGCQAAILKLTPMKINRLLPIYISTVPLSLGVDIQSQTKVRVCKPRNAIWLPGGHFESDIAKNQYTSAYDHHQHAHKIWNWNSKANLTYAPETMLPTESGNQKIQYGYQAAILKVTSLKINRHLPMTTINMHMKFEIEILKRTWLMLQTLCRLQTDVPTDGHLYCTFDISIRWSLMHRILLRHTYVIICLQLFSLIGSFHLFGWLSSLQHLLKIPLPTSQLIFQWFSLSSNKTVDLPTQQLIFQWYLIFK